MARRKDEGGGAFTVTGPGEPERAAASLNAGISLAQTFVCRRMKDEGEFTFYVREIGTDRARVQVTKAEDGIIYTREVK